MNPISTPRALAGLLPVVTPAATNGVQPAQDQRLSCEVYKFGGTSLGDAHLLQQAAELSRSCSRPLVVVVSAMAGVTDALLAATKARDPESVRQAFEAICARHRETLAHLGGQDTDETGAVLEPLLSELGDLLRAAVVVGGPRPESFDRILATGEKLSARLLAHALSNSGAAAAVVDGDTFLETDGAFGQARPLFGIVDRAIASALQPVLDAGKIAVVTGYCGRSRTGATTTLGRGGSDYSATLIAAGLNAARVTIWTDVEGVYSANPGVVADARVLGQLNYREAGELAFYGANVLHPQTLLPVADRRIPVSIRNTFAPDTQPTEIDGRITAGSHPVKAVSAITDQALVSVEGAGMAGVPGVAARIFSALAEEDINVTMISQSSAESSVCVAIPASRAEAAEVALRRAFRMDLAQSSIEAIVVRPDMALVAAIGLGMHHAKGLAGRMFAAIGRAGVNVVAIAQGSSELNVSFAVEGADCEKAVQALHHEFGLHRIDPGQDNAEHFDLLLLGWGRISREVAKLVRERTGAIRERFGLTPRIVAIADRSGFLLRPNGISSEELEIAARVKEAGLPVSGLTDAVRVEDSGEMVRDALRYRLARPILVDLTDGSTGDLYGEAFRGHADVVTVNKAPLAGSVEAYHDLTASASEAGLILRKEATVGAGLPVLDTIETLRAAGDRILSIEACISGTLTFVLSRLEAGERFSDALAEAGRRGYLEPDPCIDLVGEDVLRKAIILSRVAGFASEGSASDLEATCEGLVDRSLLGQDPAALQALLPKLDETLAARVRKARESGRVLRYVARIDGSSIHVGPCAVEPDSPLGSLSGTDNVIMIRTERYAESPLSISGPGAGVSVTATGALTDILRIVAERSS